MSTTTALSCRTRTLQIFTVRAFTPTVRISLSTNCCRNRIDELWRWSCHSSFPSTVIPSRTSQSQPAGSSMQATTFTVGSQLRSTSARLWRISTQACQTIPTWNTAKMVSTLWDFNDKGHFHFHIFLSGKSFHVYWERVLLQNKKDVGPFTFSASLYHDGDIVFGYYYLPIDITNIEDGKKSFELSKGVNVSREVSLSHWHSHRGGSMLICHIFDEISIAIQRFHKYS